MHCFFVQKLFQQKCLMLFTLSCLSYYNVRIQMKTKKSTTLAPFKAIRMLLSSSHLQPFMPLIKENKQYKIRRLINDAVDISQTNELINNGTLHIHSMSNETENAFEKKLLEASPLRMLMKLPILRPISSLMLLWYFAVFLSIMFYYVELGLVLTYGQQVWQDQQNSAVTLFFASLAIVVLFVDMMFKLNTGYLYKGMIITSRKRVIAKYLGWRIVFDIIVIICLILVYAVGTYNMNWAKLFTVLKLVRLSQIDDFYMRKFNIYRKSKTIYVVFKLIVIIFLVSHVIGLIFYAMDYYFLTSGYYQPSFCWLVNATALNNIIDLSWQQQYLYSLYWGVNTITTISYGDIAPNNPIENDYAIFMFCFGFIVYGYVVNQIVKIIMWARGHQDEFRQQMVIMESYMEKMKVNKDLKKQVRDYLQFIYTQQNNRDLGIQAEMISKLPSDLRFTLLRNAYGSFNSLLMNIFKTDQAVKFLMLLSEKNYTVGELVFFQKQYANNLQYLHKGSLRLELYLENSGLMLQRSINPGNIVGQYEFFTRKNHQYNCLTNTPCTMYSIPYSVIQDELPFSSALRQRLYFLTYEIIFKSKYDRILQRCYFCQEAHPFSKCPKRLPTFSPYSIIQQGTKERKQFQQKIAPTMKLLLKVIEKRPTKSVKYYTLKNLKKIQQFKELTTFRNKNLVHRIEKRLDKIKRKLADRDRDFNIDSVYDWEIFEPQHNLMEVKNRYENIQKQAKNEIQLQPINISRI